MLVANLTDVLRFSSEENRPLLFQNYSGTLSKVVLFVKKSPLKQLFFWNSGVLFNFAGESEVEELFLWIILTVEIWYIFPDFIFSYVRILRSLTSKKLCVFKNVGRLAVFCRHFVSAKSATGNFSQSLKSTFGIITCFIFSNKFRSSVFYICKSPQKRKRWIFF